MKRILLMPLVVLCLGSTASAAVMDFTSMSGFAGAQNQTSFAKTVSGVGMLLQAEPVGAVLTWNPGDGIGINSTSYEPDEIEGPEIFRVKFSTPVTIHSIHLTDLFNEHGYLEIGNYELNHSGNWVQFTALPSQVLGTTNGELTVPIEQVASEIAFAAPGKVAPGVGHEFSVANIDFSRNPSTVPEPASVLVFGVALLGVSRLVRRRRSIPAG